MTLRVLLTVRIPASPQTHLTPFHSQNDDGPPDARESPYILGLYHHLVHQLGTFERTFASVLNPSPLSRLGCQSCPSQHPKVLDRFVIDRSAIVLELQTNAAQLKHTLLNKQ